MGRLLLSAVLLLGLGAWFWSQSQSKNGGEQDVQRGTVTDAGLTSGDSPELAALDESSGAAATRSVEEVFAEAWVVQFRGGASLDEVKFTLDAKRLAAPGKQGTSELLTTVDDADSSMNRTEEGASLRDNEKYRWEGLSPGTWSLEVRAQSKSLWRREVFVPAGRVTRTFIHLGLPLLIEGTVVDVSGKPLAQHFIGLVEGREPSPDSPLDWLQLSHARSDQAGRFTLDVPGEGDYRAFLGYGGKRLVEDQVPVTVTRQSPKAMEIVASIPTQLTVEVQEAGGPLQRTSYAVSVYRAKAILDIERPLPPTPEAQPIPDPSDPSLDEDVRAELIKEIEEMGRVVDPEVVALRQSVVPDGWRTDRSAALDAAGQLVLMGLPANEELRFAVARGTEPIRVVQSAIVDPISPTRVIITLPPPLEEGAAPLTVVRDAALASRLEAGPEVELIPGITWR